MPFGYIKLDTSKEKSIVTVMQPFGVVIASRFEVEHSEKGFVTLTKYLKSHLGETKVLMNIPDPITNQLLSIFMRQVFLFPL